MSKIYIVDDDRDIVDALTTVLESEGHEVGYQSDPADVVNRVSEFGADLIILDVIFPEQDDAGFEIARRLRHEPKTKKIPLLMLSAVNEKGPYSATFSNRDRDDIYLPVDQFVDKPVSPTKLIGLVKEMLG